MKCKMSKKATFFYKKISKILKIQKKNLPNRTFSGLKIKFDKFKSFYLNKID